MRFQKPREIAARVLLDREAKREYVEDILDRFLQGAQLTAPDRGLIQEIAYGVARREATLDWLISRKTAGKPQKPALRVLLRMALYQLFWLERIPDHAAVNETVELARHFGCGQQSGFVNAVLRGYLREREATEQQLEELKSTDPALGYSHQKWLCDRWMTRLGPERTFKLLEWNNTPPPTYARVNLLKTDANRLREQWAHEKVDARLVARDWLGDSLVFELQSFPALATLPSQQGGLFYVQDPSTLLSVRELDPQPGETVLDYCAAPGGKTGYIAERMNNVGRVVAHDTTPDRLDFIRENCVRLGASCVTPVLGSKLDEQLPALVDRVLVDAPCSNTGVMRRRVDLRWRVRESELERLRSTQLDLIRKSVDRLKSGGTLVYSTCSLEPEENSAVVNEALQQHPNLHLQRERLLTPWEDGVDGAYVARFVKGA